MFFVIHTETLTGQQSGTVNLRLGMTTYEQGAMTQDKPAPSQSLIGGRASAASIATPTGGAQ